MRSRSSWWGRKRVATKASAASARPTKKTGWMASASSTGPAAPALSPCRRAVMIAPMTVTPTVAPTMRENCADAVATPIIRRGAADPPPAPPLPEDEGRRQHGAQDEQADDRRRRPRRLDAARDGGVEAARGGAGEEEGAHDVDRVAFPLLALPEAEPDDDQGDRRDRQADEERPPPGGAVRDPAARGRPEHRRDGEDATREALPLAAAAGRDDVADHGDGERDEAAGAQSLHRAPGDQELERRREASEHGAGREEEDPEDEERPASVQVGELPVEGDGDRHAEHVGGEDPRVLLEPAQVRDDPRRRRGDDRLVQRRDEHAEHESGEDDQRAALAERVDGAVIHIRYATKV